ncbi:phosphatase PAP2 family protein [Microbacterium sp. B2969]|uniref:Phosphatase PAP2 family protein n=1 Tax=Microbacterium alkaliflavum TaxID=3248839 RepID=A0ABW7Q363_9MICO
MEDVKAVATGIQTARLPRGRLLVIGLVLIAASTALGAWILVRGTPPFAVDVWWNDLLLSWGSSFMLGFSLVMNFLGGGWVGVFAVPLAITLTLVFLRRPWSAAYFVASSVASALLVQLLKHTFGRARPEDIQVVSDYGSYPSGHVANAATIATAVAIVFPRLVVFIGGAVYVLLMALSRTYLHAHWLSDTLGGAMAGAGVALVLAAIFIGLVRREPVPRVTVPKETNR